MSHNAPTLHFNSASRSTEGGFLVATYFNKKKENFMNSEKQGSTKTSKENKGDKQEVRNKFGDRIFNDDTQDIDAKRHPEEQVVKDKPDLNGPPNNQKI
jgi:hypothetical protein